MTHPLHSRSQPEILGTSYSHIILGFSTDVFKKEYPYLESQCLEKNGRDSACCKNHAYHPWTAGFGPEALASAPATKPAIPLPLVPQAGECIFSHLASSHSDPTSMRTTNHMAAEPSDARKNLASAGSGKRSLDTTGVSAGAGEKRWREEKHLCEGGREFHSNPVHSCVFV
jgi:hypothetical protein